jgi:hypothetical protein
VEPPAILILAKRDRTTKDTKYANEKAVCSSVGDAHPNHRERIFADELLTALATVTRFRAARGRKWVFVMDIRNSDGSFMARAAQVRNTSVCHDSVPSV